MATYTEKLCRKYFRPEDHPYVLYEKLIGDLLEPGHTLMDAGCGRGAPNLLKFKEKCSRLVGVDMVEPLPEAIEAGVEYHNRDLATTGLPDNLADVIISRSVLEHLEDPETVFSEFARILKPGGTFVATVGAVLYLVSQGATGAAVGQALWGFLLVGSLDSFLRPILIRVSGGAEIPFVLVLLGVLGGLSAFGLLGLLIGPVVLAVVFALVSEIPTREELLAAGGEAAPEDAGGGGE